jgi:hypothetical protein
MKPIKECSREELLERALLAIEALTFTFDESNAEQFSQDIYMIAHAASSRCCTPAGWLEKIEEIEKTGKSEGVYDVEKILAKTLTTG